MSIIRISVVAGIDWYDKSCVEIIINTYCYIKVSLVIGRYTRSSFSRSPISRRTPSLCLLTLLNSLFLHGDLKRSSQSLIPATTINRD